MYSDVINFLKFLLIGLFVAALGLQCCAGFSRVVASGFSRVAVHGCLISVASLVGQGLQGTQASVAVPRGL